MLNGYLYGKFAENRFRSRRTSIALARPIAVSLFAMLSCLFSGAPAFAGHWGATVYTYSGSRQSHNKYQNYGPYAWSPTGGGLATGPNDSQLSASTSGTITATVTWESDFPGDNPPAKVNLKETAFAQWTMTSGTVDDSAPVWTASGIANCGLSPGQFSEPRTATTAKGRHEALKTTADFNSSSGVITRSVSPSASMTGTTGDNVFGSLMVSCGYTLSVYAAHPHPTNYHQHSGTPYLDGRLEFEYRWDSTSGLKAPDGIGNVDLDHIYVGEYVTYPDTADPYIPPDPPFYNGLNGDWSFSNPTETPNTNVKNGNAGKLYDTHRGLSGFRNPHKAGPFSFTATQIYRFHCADCMNDGEYEKLMGPLFITRKVENITADYENGTWEYSVHKAGLTASKEVVWDIW